MQRVSNEATFDPSGRFTLGARDIGDLSGGALSPPLVTFVVINWNYAAYVGAAIDSIRGQDYPDFECIVINNGSTDDSAAVIARHVAGDDRFRIVTFPENRGQLGAALAALDWVKGGLVTFVDADDVLFRNYASFHVQAHLALSQAVAFTSSCAVEMDAEGHVLASTRNLPRLNKSRSVAGLQPEVAALRVPAVSKEDYDALSESTVLLRNSEQGWLWGSGTSNMYRTSVLRMIRLGNGHDSYFRSADGYFNVASHALAGSALIDRSLSGYRIHGKNYFSAREKFAGLRSGTQDYVRAWEDAIYDDELRFFLGNANSFAWMLGKGYFRFIDQITRAGSSRRKLRRFYRDRRAVLVFVEFAPRLKATFGRVRFAINILRRFSPRRAFRIIRSAHG